MHGSQDTNKVQLDSKSFISLYSIYSILLFSNLFSILKGKWDSKYLIQLISQCALAFFVLFVKLWLPYNIFLVLLWTKIHPTGISLFYIAFSQYLNDSSIKCNISSFEKSIFKKL